MVNLLIKPWYKKWWGILIIFFSTLILIIITAFIFAIANEIKRFKSMPEKQKILGKINYTEARKHQVEGQDNYWLGSSNPKVTIVEFADFSCPLCKNSYNKIREISVNYKNDVKILFRDFPGSEASLILAMAGRCAGEQGLFWPMHDKLFINQGATTKQDLIELDLIELANQIGADLDKFNQCLEEQKYLNEIQQDFSQGDSLGVKGTPTWFINGVKIEGDIPYDLFIQIVEELIQE